MSLHSFSYVSTKYTFLMSIIFRNALKRSCQKCHRHTSRSLGHCRRLLKFPNQSWLCWKNLAGIKSLSSWEGGTNGSKSKMPSRYVLVTSFVTTKFPLTEETFLIACVQESARDKNIDVTDVIQLDDYIPNQVETINKIARKTYQRTRGKVFLLFFSPNIV